MRVLFIHCRYRLAGGERVVVDREVSWLRAAGHDVEVLGFDNPTNVAATATSLALAVWNPTSAARTTRAISEFEPDVVHLHNTWFAASPSVPAAVRRADVPMVTTLHNYRFVCVTGGLFRDGRVCTECVDGSDLSAVRHRCYRDSGVLSALGLMAKRTNAALRRDRTELCIAPSDYVAGMAVRSGFDASQVVVVPHGSPDPGERSSAPSASGTVMFAGRLAEGKGVSCLLDAWERAQPRGLTLDIVGEGDTPGPERALPAGVRMLGPRPRSEVMSLMLSSRAFVAPSEWHEPFGLVLVEALAAGLPVVAFDVGSISGILGDGAVAVVPPGERSLATALESLSNDEMLDATGAAARSRYERFYRPEAHVEKLTAVYRRAIDA